MRWLRGGSGRQQWEVNGRGGSGSIEKEEESKERHGNNKQQRQSSVHNNQTEYVGRRATETVAATLVAMVMTPKSTRP